MRHGHGFQFGRSCSRGLAAAASRAGIVTENLESLTTENIEPIEAE